MWKEFFYDDNSVGSMTRLVLFGVFVVASLVILWYAYEYKISDIMFTTYMGMPAAAYAYGKKKDVDAATANPTQP